MEAVTMATHEAVRERQAFKDAAEWFSDVSGHTRNHLEVPALGEWCVRDLLGHTSRALSTLSDYLTNDAGNVDLESPIDYFRVASRAASPSSIAQRGRDAGRALGDDPADRLQVLFESVWALVDSSSDDVIAITPFGRMRLADYLPTRTFELTVHTCDLVAAIAGRPEPPRAAAASALRLAVDAVEEPAVAAQVLLSLTGRCQLPDGFTVL